MTHGLTLRSPEGTTYRFDPGALCLEFLLTGGPGPPARHHTLHAPADLAAFAAVSRLGLDAEQVRVTPEELADAVRLRDDLWRLARDRVHGRPLEDPAILNAAAAVPPLAPRAQDGVRRWAVPVSGAQLLSQIARDAVELFTGPLRERVRECATGDCFLIFMDASRPGTRRWCSMERCGNRHKVRSHRARGTA
ncbi:CGNR zinc finger domain-containing protein [Sphaerisporangium perillae]|uniref:CGNR zinc finger domain-containing protein n=1 Tax=Sphaerisporangium perillae TaxID=2935860 RepID=UPI00200FB4A4|nr:ABATE domain-containing protein [Sphaerisporangium perillae]